VVYEKKNMHVYVIGNVCVTRYEALPPNKAAAEAFDEAVIAWTQAQ